MLGRGCNEGYMVPTFSVSKTLLSLHRTFQFRADPACKGLDLT